MRAEQSPAPALLQEPPRFKLLREIPVKDAHGGRRRVTVPMTEYLGADALRTMRALLRRRPDAGKQPIP